MGGQCEERGKSPHVPVGGAPTASASPWESPGVDGGSHPEETEFRRSELVGLNSLYQGIMGQDIVVTNN